MPVSRTIPPSAFPIVPMFLIGGVSCIFLPLLDPAFPCLLAKRNVLLFSCLSRSPKRLTLSQRLYTGSRR